MNCGDIDRLLASHGGVALSAARNHAAVCPRCRELLRAVAVDERGGASNNLRPELANAIASRMAGDLTAVRPLPSTGSLTTAFALIFAALALLGGLALGDRGLLRMDWLTAAIVFASLIVCAGLLAFALSGQMTPGSRQLAHAWKLALGILLGLAVVFAVLFPYGQEEAFWPRAWACLRVGLATGAMAALVFWLILRRGAMLDPRASGALAGLLGGLTGAAILEIHCPDFNAAHILVGHWGAALLGAGIGWLNGGVGARRDQAGFRRS